MKDNKEMTALMKSFLTLSFLLTAILLFPGCYTILPMEPTDEDVSSDPGPITIYVLVPYPQPEPPPYPPPAPPPYIPAPVYVNDNPPSAPPPSSDDHREIHTGRGPAISNPAPAKNENTNNGTRDSGVQRGRR